MVEFALYLCRFRSGDLATSTDIALVGPLIGPIITEHESVGRGGRAPKWLEAAPRPRTMGRRVNHTGAHIPPPTPNLVRGMALASWAAYSSSMELLLDHEMPDWDELPLQVQEIWLASAKAAYACIALYGGARLEDLGDDAKAAG